MKRRINLTTIIALLCFISVFSCDSQEIIKKIAIYYIGWDIDTYVPQTCEDLVLKGELIEIDNRIEIKKISEYINNMELIEITDEYMNARICCKFYDANKNTIKTMVFSPPSTLTIDGVYYEWNKGIFDLITNFLPNNYRVRIY